MEERDSATDAPLWPYESWPPVLQSAHSFITTSPTPAAIYWGEHLVVTNCSWPNANIDAERPLRARRTSVSGQAAASLRSFLHGLPLKHCSAAELLGDHVQDGDFHYPILSPLFDETHARVVAVLVQLFRRPRIVQMPGEDTKTSHVKAARSDQGDEDGDSQKHHPIPQSNAKGFQENVRPPECKHALEAASRKEQQERFIDMISHEIRNPLSAVLHCSEDIMEAIHDLEASDTKDRVTEAVETILHCVTHQKAIVDDVLSVSKLDASMLSLLPRDVRPKPDLADTLKIFQPEFRKKHITFEYQADRNYDDTHIDWVKADLTRIGQVVINLVSNAMKFTEHKQGEKNVTVSIGASTERPTSYPPNVVFFQTDNEAYRRDGTASSEWGNGQVIYILVAVKDTGVGIPKDSQKRLFERFQQGTPKTEVMYGGSGLGLNISRRLCHLHGGKIGVSSVEGQGSTFGFFFKVRMVEKPQDKMDQDDVTRHNHTIQDEVSALGDEAPQTVESHDVPKSLKEVPVRNIPEVSPVRQEDHMYARTKEVSDEVYNERSDEKSSATTSDSHANQTELPVRPLPTTPEVQRNSSFHILVVEDNLINQRILKRKLISKRFAVTTADHGREAVEAFKRTEFDVILMDQEMPVLDGNGATREIRAMEKAPQLLQWPYAKAQTDKYNRRGADNTTICNIPIIGVTANVREEQIEEMIAAGMDDVVRKPYSTDALVAKISEMCPWMSDRDK